MMNAVSAALLTRCLILASSDRAGAQPTAQVVEFGNPDPNWDSGPDSLKIERVQAFRWSIKAGNPTPSPRSPSLVTDLYRGLMGQPDCGSGTRRAFPKSR